MPSILIVDEHVLIRLGLRKMLGEEIRSLVFAEAKSSNEAAIRFTKQAWDLVILAIALPGKDGFEVLQEIRRLHPTTRVLVLSMHDDSRYAERARQLGAFGYVCKSAVRAELLRAVKSILDGKKYFENLPFAGSDGANRHAGLSTQEYKIMMALVTGKRSGEIAAELNLSVKTVSTYKRRVLDKMGLRSTADLVRYAIEFRLS